MEQMAQYGPFTLCLRSAGTVALLCRTLTENPALQGPLPEEFGYLLSLFDM